MKKLRHRGRSPYQTIEVYDDRLKGRRVRHLSLDGFEHSALDLADPKRPVWIYTDFVSLAALFNKDPRRVFIAGLGGGVMPLSLRRRHPRAVIEAAELDPVVAKAAARWFGVKEGPRLKILVGDARRLLKSADGVFDLIVLDVFRRKGGDLLTPSPFLSADFFRTVRAHLSRDGAFVFNLMGRLSGKAGATLAVVRRLEKAFPQVYLFPIFLKKAPDLSEERNIMVVCAMGRERLDARAIRRRARRLARARPAAFRRLPEYAENYLSFRAGRRASSKGSNGRP
jgi:spermidine synthase